jgi:5-methylcytosine-specific restriction endonuclease McrA
VDDAELAGRVNTTRPKTRAEAKQLGQKNYWPEKTCRAGHTNGKLASNGRCVQCNRDAQNTYRLQNPEKVKARKRADYARKRQEIIRRSSLWAASNKEKRDHIRTKWAELNPQKNIDAKRRWDKKNPEKKIAHKHKRRALYVAAKGSFTARCIKEILAHQKSKCAYCRRPLDKKRHIDHITPLAGGGTNYRANLQLLCPPCNLKKGSRDPLHFVRQEFGMLL